MSLVHRVILSFLVLVSVSSCGADGGDSSNASDTVLIGNHDSSWNVPDVQSPDMQSPVDVEEKELSYPDLATDIWEHRIDNTQPEDWTAPQDVTPPPPDDDEDGIPNSKDPYPQDPNEPGTVLPWTVYAHTSGELYLLDVKLYKVQKVADFGWPFQGANHSMTDIAIDRYGIMYGISFDDLYRVNPNTGACTYLGALPDSFNGLTMVPAGIIDETEDTLVAVSQSGGWYKLSVVANNVGAQKLGSYSGQYSSSGDVYSIAGVGTFASANKGSSGDDFLVKLDPNTGLVQQEIGPISGYGAVWGMAGWTGKAFAFDAGGDVLVVDTTNAKVTVIAETGKAWWGAGVKTEIEGD